jgi:hypothetical protein
VPFDVVERVDLSGFCLGVQLIDHRLQVGRGTFHAWPGGGQDRPGITVDEIGRTRLRAVERTAGHDADTLDDRGPGESDFSPTFVAPTTASWPRRLCLAGRAGSSATEVDTGRRVGNLLGGIDGRRPPCGHPASSGARSIGCHSGMGSPPDWATLLAT